MKTYLWNWIAPVLLIVALGHAEEFEALDEVEGTRAIFIKHTPEHSGDTEEKPAINWQTATQPIVQNQRPRIRRAILIRRGGRTVALPSRPCQPDELQRVPLPEAADPKEIPELIQQLNNDDALERNAAHARLLASGRGIVPELHAACKTFSELEPKKRIEQLLTALEGYGPEVDGVAIKVVPEKTTLRLDETLALRVYCLNRGEYTRLLNTGGMRHTFRWSTLHAEQENSSLSTGWGYGSSDKSNERYVFLAPQAVYEETWTIRFQPEPPAEEVVDSDEPPSVKTPCDVFNLDHPGKYTFSLTLPEQWEFNAGHKQRRYFGGDHYFESCAEIHVGGLKANKFTLKLLPAKAK